MATTKKSKTKKYGAKATKKIGDVMHEWKEGALHSGRGGKVVKNAKQAVAIGISEARHEGDKVPKQPKRKTAKRTAKKTAKKRARR